MMRTLTLNKGTGNVLQAGWTVEWTAGWTVMDAGWTISKILERSGNGRWTGW